MKKQAKCVGPKWLTEDSNRKMTRWGKGHLGGHDVERGVERYGEASIWRRKCSGHAQQRLEPKLMNRCKPEKWTLNRRDRC